MMHLKRWLTGIIAVPFLIYVIGFGPIWLFSAFIAIVSLVGLGEFYKMVATGVPKWVLATNYPLAFLIHVVFYMRQALLAPVIITFWAFVPMTIFMLSATPSKKVTEDMGKSVLGIVYVVIPLALLIMIHLRHDGKYWIFFLLVVIFATDTGAFYSGKFFGRHKLHQTVSPGKTWEGAVGGLLASIVAALWFLHFRPIHRVDLGIVALVIALCVVGQIGDLVESMVKRNHGVKDSGGILPGHGGLLDRIDGLLFSIPVLNLYLIWPV